MQPWRAEETFKNTSVLFTIALEIQTHTHTACITDYKSIANRPTCKDSLTRLQ